MTDDGLKDACEFWQGGRDHSSLIRAAARVRTRTPHYFSAPFISDHETAARGDETAIRRATTLMDALASTPFRDPAQWSEMLGVGDGWIGRGIHSGDQDDQIIASLKTGRLRMPLWGASLDEQVARSFGTRFLFELVGSFPAIPAWLHSGSKSEERELIVGGVYAVESIEQVGDTTEVHLRFDSLVRAVGREG